MKTLNYIKLNESGVANVVSALHQLLADFQVYYTNLRGFHWNIKGHGFFVLHEKFESMYDDAAEKVDEIAERILMLGGVPENKFSEYLKVAKIKKYLTWLAAAMRSAIFLKLTDTSLVRRERSLNWLMKQATTLLPT